MRILYNPYDKQFDFRYMADGRTFQDIDGRSGLAKFTGEGVALQNCLPEIFEVISKDYALDSEGIDVEFCGTAFDYDDFYAALKSHVQKPGKDNLKCSELHYELIASATALETVRQAYEKIKSEFPDTGNAASEKTREIASIVEKYNSATKSELNLVVVGTYSSGKSTFINALIGVELLPRGEDPTTGQISKISAGIGYSIQLDVILDPKHADEASGTIEMRWKDGSFGFEHRLPPEKVSFLLGLLGKRAEQRSREKGGENPVAQMHAVISCFNELFEKEKNKEKVGVPGCRVAPLLRITLPFRIGDIASDELSVNIFDTPGSDAEISPQHLDTLEAALGRQTNALPILLIKRSDMVKSGNSALRELLKRYGTNMDLANMLVVVTHGDEISRTDLEAGFKPEVLSEWKFRRILFISSVVALGAKKKGALSDGTYAEKYNNGQNMFRPDNDYYRRLYEYAILPDENEMAALRQAAAGNSISHDCGIFSVEYEMQLYADKFLQYLKVRQRCGYLLEALQKAAGQLEEEKVKVDSEKKKHKEAKAEKAAELKEKLSEFDIPDAEFVIISNAAEKKYNMSLQVFADELHTITKEKWKGLSHDIASLFKKDNQQALHRQMDAHCNSHVHQNFLEIEEYIKKFHLVLAEQASSRLAGIIQADSDLSDEAKGNLLKLLTNASKAPEFSTGVSPHFSHKNAFADFLFFHWIDPKQYASELKNAFLAFYMDECVMEPYERFKRQFEEWIQKTKAGFIAKLNTGSLTLRKYDECIQMIAAEIDSMSQRLANLSSVERELECLLAFPKEARE